MKQTVGGAEILQGKVAVGAARLLQHGMNAAQARFGQGQFAGGIAADAIAAILELQLLLAMLPQPELQPGLMGGEGLPGLTAGGGTLSPGAAQGRSRQLPPALAHGRGGDVIEQMVSAGGTDRCGGWLGGRCIGGGIRPRAGRRIGGGQTAAAAGP